MAIKTKSDIKKQEIDLLGPEGDAFVLLGYAYTLHKQTGGISNKTWTEIQNKMTSGDYENLITVFDREFGDYVDLVK